MRTLDEVERTDLIIVPAVHEDHAKAIAMNEAAITWIRERHHQGASVAAYCIGVFLLAETGILDGRTCSTHWGEAEHLRTMYPEVDVCSEKIITAQDGVYTSGGAYAFTNLVVHLIERYGGRELAIMTAKTFMIDVDKCDQSFFSMFSGQKQHDDALVRQVQERIEARPEEALNVEDLAAGHATNRRTLERRFRSATGNSILQYMQRVRVESAKHILEQEHKQVADAMYAVGYTDAKAFRKVFKKHVGVSPSTYRKKFQRAVSLVG